MSESRVRMRFAVGDKVTVQSEDFRDQCGLRGTVVRVLRGDRLPYLVIYDAGQKVHPYLATRWHHVTENTYSAQDLVLTGYMDDTRTYLETLAELKGSCHG